VDAASGRPCADFGVNGQVDIKQGMGQVYPGMVSITAPPVIVRGLVIIGQQVLDGQTNSAPSGVIQAFDAVTGARRWAWDLGRPGETGWPEPGKEFTRGTPNMWTTASADEGLGLVYLPMGNSAVDYYSADRSPQENKFSTALVALDVTSGQPVWNSRRCIKMCGITIWAARQVWSICPMQHQPSYCPRSRAIYTYWIVAPDARFIRLPNTPCRRAVLSQSSAALHNLSVVSPR